MGRGSVLGMAIGSKEKNKETGGGRGIGGKRCRKGEAGIWMVAEKEWRKFEKASGPLVGTQEGDERLRRGYKPKWVEGGYDGPFAESLKTGTRGMEVMCTVDARALCCISGGVGVDGLKVFKLLLAISCV